MFNIYSALTAQVELNQKLTGNLYNSLIKSEDDWFIQNWPSKEQIADFKLKVALIKGGADYSIFKKNIYCHFILLLVLKRKNIKISKFLIKNIIELSGAKYCYK